MRTEEFIKRIEDFGLSVMFGLDEIHVFYEGGQVASVDRQYESLVSVDLDRGDEEPMMNSVIREHFLNIICEYATTPLKDRKKKRAKTVSLELPYEDVELAMRCLDRSVYRKDIDETEVKEAEVLYYELMDILEEYDENNL